MALEQSISEKILQQIEDTKLQLEAGLLDDPNALDVIKSNSKIMRTYAQVLVKQQEERRLHEELQLINAEIQELEERMSACQLIQEEKKENEHSKTEILNRLNKLDVQLRDDFILLRDEVEQQRNQLLENVKICFQISCSNDCLNILHFSIPLNGNYNRNTLLI